MRKIYALAGTILALPAVALAATPRTFQELASFAVTILNSGTGLLILLGVVVYFYGISINILKIGEGEKEKIKAYFFWGIIVIFLMVSIWGILRLLQNTLFGSDRFSPTTGSPIQRQDQFQAPVYLE